MSSYGAPPYLRSGRATDVLADLDELDAVMGVETLDQQDLKPKQVHQILYPTASQTTVFVVGFGSCGSDFQELWAGLALAWCSDAGMLIDSCWFWFVCTVSS